MSVVVAGVRAFAGRGRALVVGERAFVAEGRAVVVAVV